MVPYPSPYMVPTPYMYPLPPPPTHLVNSNMASFYPSPYYPDLLLSQDIQQNTSINENDLIQQDNDKDDNNNSFQQDMINGDIRIMNNIFTFEFPKDDNLSKDMFLSICNKIWMENVELNKRHHQKH